MRRMTLRRPQKDRRARRTLVAVGALGAAAETVRRWRHRQHAETEH